MLEIVKFWKDFVPNPGNNTHPQDKKFIDETGKTPIALFSSKLTKSLEPDCTFRLGLLPQPYMGNLAKSRIVLVMLNPGYAGTEFEEHKDLQARKAILDTINQNFSGDLAGSNYMYMNELFKDTAGYRYLCCEPRNPIKGCLRDCIVQYAKEKGISIENSQQYISNNLCMIELFPYHSAKFGKVKPMINDLPSHLQAKAFIIEKAKDKKNLIFLVRGAERFDESFLSQKNVIRFGQGESRKMYFTLHKHGKKLLDHIM